MAAESLVLLVNVIILCIAYFYVYPKFVKDNLKALTMNDIVSNIVALVVIGSLYGGTEQTFSLLLFEVDWFWFTLITFFLMEAPFALAYLKKYKPQ
ncbi:hypothetical protein [Paraferrimonas sp. SM1919]|uniref:hypothetical protein n=1 Tax=Paraferrimonas sp. SM1919 TaxID=2662263 RepID=UPI0013D3C7DE|nr:hypothetical protein [Paraferrimonas sp. SM1919]